MPPLITFYGKTELFFQTGLINEQSRLSLSSSLSQLEADGRFTDIGNALDRLNSLLSHETEDSDLKRYLLLITDGIQEAPPESPYYSPDGSFNHRFLETTKEIQKKGWKIVILGIGTDTAARKVSQELDGIYKEITGTITPQRLQEATEDLIAIVTLSEYSQDMRIDREGKTTGRILLEGSGFSQPMSITIRDIQFEDPRGDSKSLAFPADYPRIIELTPGSVQEILLPLDFSSWQEIGPEGMTGDLHFIFEDDSRFTPAVVTATILPPRTGIPWWWLLILLLVLLLMAFLVLRKKKGPAQQSRLPLQTISVIMDGDLKAQRVFQVRPGDSVFLKKDSFGISLVKDKVTAPLARVMVRLDEVFMDITKDGDLKALSSLEGNILDRRLSFRFKDNQRFTLQVKRNNETK